MEQKTGLTTNVVLELLKQKVSVYNARLLLETALIESGMQNLNGDMDLKAEEARNLCLKLISKGGPSFQVGQNLYRKFLQ